MGSLERREAERIGLVCTVGSDVLGGLPKVERVYLATFGHGVDHLHIWLIPRYEGTPENVFGAAVLTWNGGPRSNREELQGLAATIGETIRGHPLLAAE